MPTPAWTRVVIFVTAGLMLAAAIALGIPLDEELGRVLGIVALGVVALIGIFNLWAWRLLPLAITRGRTSTAPGERLFRSLHRTVRWSRSGK